MKKTCATLIIAIIFSIFSSLLYAAEDKTVPSGETASAKEPAAGKPAAEVLVPVNIPLFSPLFSGFPLATVDDEPITVNDLATALAGAHEQMGEEKTAGKKNFSDMLNRLVNVKLIVAEAKNMGLGDLQDVKEMVDAYAKRTLIELVMDKHVKDAKPDKAEVERLYGELAREYRVTSVMVEKEADAKKIGEEIKAGKDFKAIVKEFVDKGAKGGEDEKYVKKADLLPEIAGAVAGMKTGQVSPAIKIESGFVFIRIEDSRLPEKEDAKEMEKAEAEALHLKKRSALTDFKKKLVKQNVKINAPLFKSLDFEAKKPGFDAMLKDKRVIATVKEEKPITVAELARGIQGKYYHGIAEGIESKTVNEKKLLVFDELVHKRIFRREAIREGIDRSAEYKNMVKSYEDSILFGTFVEKVIVPEVKLKEEEVKAYYDSHIADYSYPEMIRINSIAFMKKENAEDAIEKLRKGTDFNWLLANAEGRAPKDAKDVLVFKGDLLITKDLPEGVRSSLSDAKPGDLRLYSGENYSYVLSIKDVVPAKPQPFDDVKKEAAKKVFDEKIAKSMDDWAKKLRQAYKVKIYAVNAD